jgi:hypothetical protein
MLTTIFFFTRVSSRNWYISTELYAKKILKILYSSEKRESSGEKNLFINYSKKKFDAFYSNFIQWIIISCFKLKTPPGSTDHHSLFLFSLSRNLILRWCQITNNFSYFSCILASSKNGSRVFHEKRTEGKTVGSFHATSRHQTNAKIVGSSSSRIHGHYETLKRFHLEGKILSNYTCLKVIKVLTNIDILWHGWGS